MRASWQMLEEAREQVTWMYVALQDIAEAMKMFDEDPDECAYLIRDALADVADAYKLRGL